MPKPAVIELRDGTVIPILHEDHAVLAIDKPAGWMLAPDSWNRTGRNLQLALVASLRAGDFWARSRRLSYLRFVHRLDADTSGVLLLAKHSGVLRSLSRLFESRQVTKAYLAVVRGVPKPPAWTCNLAVAPDPQAPGRMRIDARRGKEAQTHFRVIETAGNTTLVEATPTSGRTHQIRVHLAAAGHPVVGDHLYGPGQPSRPGSALRAIELSYLDPFTKRRIRIRAATEAFCRHYGFSNLVASRRSDDV